MTQTRFTVRLTDWSRDELALRAVRTSVFIFEQAIPADLEWDPDDSTCVHALAVADDGTPVGCGRLLQDGHIGRIAVLREWRGSGVGAALLERLIRLARTHGHVAAVLNAQTHALAFYAKQGFVSEGPVYIEAGLPHQTMRLVL